MNAAFSTPSAAIGAGEPGQATILLVEANAAMGCELVEQLRAEGYCAALAQSAEHARVLARTHTVRAVLLGSLEGSRAALDLLEEIRKPVPLTEGSVWDEHLPLIVCGPRATQLDLLRAFEAGADDFIAGDDHYYLELRVRLKALLRRAERLPGMRGTRLCVGSLEIDTSSHLVRVAGVPVHLCRLEYELLVHLARDPTGVCTKQQLLRAIWHQRSPIAGRTVDSHASRLRRKLDDAGAPGLVINVWGVGYRLT